MHMKILSLMVDNKTSLDCTASLFHYLAIISVLVLVSPEMELEREKVFL